MVSLLDNELFLIPSILALAPTAIEGVTQSPSLTPARAAAPARAVPARNLRRFKYKLLGVISDDRTSAGFLINMGTSSPQCTGPTARWIGGRRIALLDRTQVGGKSCTVAGKTAIRQTPGHARKEAP